MLAEADLFMRSFIVAVIDMASRPGEVRTPSGMKIGRPLTLATIRDRWDTLVEQVGLAGSAARHAA